MAKNTETLKSIESSKKWTVVLSEQGTADIHEGLLGKIIISLPFEKKEIADLICRCFNAHDILVKQRDELLEACKTAEVELEQRYKAQDGSPADKVALKIIKAAIAKAI